MVKIDFVIIIEIFDWLIGYLIVFVDSNLELIDYVVNWFEDMGVWVKVSCDVIGVKVNFFVILGLDMDGGIVLFGYIDVVFVNVVEWISDFF